MASFSSDDDVAILQGKIGFLVFAVFIFVLTVVVRLFYLQIYQGDLYRSLSEQISVREEEVRARRGLILDRNGKVLADNRPYFEIVVIPQYVTDKDRTIDSLAKIIPIDAEAIKTKLKSLSYVAPFWPVVLVDDAPYDWVARIRQYERQEYTEEVPINLEGVEVRIQNLRVYKYPEFFSHALGYLKEIDKPTLEKYEDKYPDVYSSGDLMGASGIEWAYDRELRGKDGVNARVVDARGREIRGDPELVLLQERTSIAPVDGYHLVTSLDFDAQVAAAQALGDRRGAVVAMDPWTGEIIALYSSPWYDANRITKNIDKEYWKMINLHEDKYLLNRTIQATYPPGSIYKVVTAIAGLDLEKIKPETRFSCGGGMQFGNRFFKCWNKGGHGSLPLLHGISQSCDVYFYQTGLKVGVDGLHKYANMFGFGHKTDIEIPFEQSGLIPSTEWKMKRHKQPWIESETLSISIGQGYDLVTPLQASKMIAMVANNGHIIRPHLGKSIVDIKGNKVKDLGEPLGKQVVPLNHLTEVQKGVVEVIHGYGTAKRLQASPYKIAGKTGTAQVIGHDSRLAMTDRRQPHGWFVAYAPHDNPKIAVAVVVENGRSGSGSAAPVAQQVIDAYLGRIMPIQKENTGDRSQESGGDATEAAPGQPTDSQATGSQE